jgi:hypothetical protein
VRAGAASGGREKEGVIRPSITSVLSFWISLWVAQCVCQLQYRPLHCCGENAPSCREVTRLDWLLVCGTLPCCAAAVLCCAGTCVRALCTAL